MAEINLRAYIKNIDDLVEHTKLDEAIAHCRHILEIYPKHLATYRLLGKAYLEAKRYGDAADIFQRVLSAIPDDFVAHIGMAIVREDEGNLDAAIWHMERAFETNPANPAIQQELRRLIGSRDGLEPHKVRLTRGALARMYAHGELYPQAIAELVAALQEDAGRPDLQALLAMMYWRAGQHPEAAEVCNQLLEKLPYCRDANQIMGAILQTGGRTDDAVLYHKRLASLDPYAAFVETASVDPQTVDANSVQIEKLDWQPSMPQAIPTPEPSEPDWAASLGMELDEDKVEEPSAGPEPSWLKDLDSPEEEEELEAVESTPFTPSSDTPTPGAPSEDQLPGWMKDAGWRESNGDVPEPRISFSDDELDDLDRGVVPSTEDETPAEGDELAPAEIPDWLQEIAPQADQEPPPEPSPEPDEEESKPLPGWLGELAEDAAAVQPEPDIEPAEEPEPLEEELEPASEEQVGADVSELPAWLDQESPGATSTIVSWLGGRKEEREEIPAEPSDIEEPAVPAPEDELEAEATEELPDWLQELEPTDEALEPESPTPGEGAAPSWLAGVAEVAAQQDLSAAEVEPVPEEPTPEAESEMPEWLDEASEIQPEETAETAEPEQEAPDWLKSLAEPEPEEIPEGEQIPEEASEEAPDWLAGVGVGEEQLPSMERPESVEGPEWLEEIGEPEVALPPETREGMDAAPDWLRGIEEEPSEVEPVAEQPASVDWLRELQADEAPEPEELFEVGLDADEEAEMPVPSLEAETLEPEPEAEAPPGESMDDNEIFEWLEGLAARQGAAEEELITSPDERTTEPPARVEAMMETPGVSEEPIPAEPEESLEWLERLAAERGIDADVSLPEEGPEEPVEVDETPEAAAWLGRMATEPVSEAPGEPEQAIPEWLVRGEPEAPEPAEEILPAELPPEEPEIEEPAFEIQEIEPQAIEPEAVLPSEVTPLEEAGLPEELPEWMPEEEFLPTAEEPPLEEPSPAVIEEPVVEEPPPPVVELPPEAPAEEVTPEIPSEALDVETVPSAGAPARPSELPEPMPPAPAEPVEPPAIPAEPAPPPAEAVPAAPAPPPAEAVPAAPVPTEEPVAVIPEPEVPPAEEVAEAPPPPPSKPKAKPSASELLESARQSLARGNVQEAVKNYSQLTKQKASLDAVIDDLRIAIERNPNQPTLWQALGDAYMKADQLSEAIEAYRKGTEATK
jgi:tetratricopeptide (TPR) repeat protein